MSLGSVLGTARSALAAQQLVIDTAGHNIANAQTAGYTRQRVELEAAAPQRMPYGQVGAGVQVTDITRSRDELLDTAVRRESGGESAATQRHALLSGVEEILGEPSDTGLAAAMDAFWSAWSDLAAQPGNAAAKPVVVQRGEAAATMLNQFDGRLADLRTQAAAAVDAGLTQVNGLARQVADLNQRIVADEVGGHESNDLRDARDRAVDQLATFGAVQALPKPDGSVQVVFGTYALVEGIAARQLQRTTDADGSAALAFADQPGQALKPVGGSTQENLDFLNGGARDVQDRLDALASGLARAVNQVVAQHTDASGAPAGPFFVSKVDGQFDAAANPFARPAAAGTVTARTISVRAALAADASALPASSSAARPSDNDLALAIAGLRTSPTATLGGVSVAFRLPDRSKAPTTTGGVTTPALAAAAAPTTFADFYNATVSGLGVQVKAAADDAEVRGTLAGQARARRDSADGVNVDEELTTLMQAQQAYAAAAKVVTAADEMMKTLVEMI